MSIERDYTVITLEMEKFYKLDQVELPPDFTTEFDDFINPSIECNNKYAVSGSDIFQTIFDPEATICYPKYSSWADKLVIDDGATEGPDDQLLVRCKHCKKLFQPTLGQIK